MSERDPGPLGFADSEPPPPGRPDRPKSSPSPAPPPPARPPTSRYRWIIGVAVVGILAYITLNTLHSSPARLKPGSRLPAFALPLAVSSLDGDANLARQGPHAACRLRGPRFAGRILQVCPAAGMRPLVLLIVTLHGGCERQLDVAERVRPAFPQAELAAVIEGGSHADARKAVLAHGWRFPVGWDHRGDVFALYGGNNCPVVLFAEPGLLLMRNVPHAMGEAELRRRVAALLVASERHAVSGRPGGA